MAAARIPDDEKDAVKNYKQQEFLLGKHDLNPPFSDPDPKIKSPSPGFIRQELMAGRYHQTKQKEGDIITKLQRALDEATEAQRLYFARTKLQPDPTDGHQLRIDIYTALIANPTTWQRAP